MSDTSKTPRRGSKRTPAEEVAEPAVLDDRLEDAADPAEGADARPAQEDGVSEASAEAMIAALVEAERAAEAEELAVQEAEEAAEREEPDDDEVDDDAADDDAADDDGADDAADAPEALEPEVAEEIAVEVEVEEEIAVEDELGVADELTEDAEEQAEEEAADELADEDADDEPLVDATAPSRRLAVLGSPIGHSRSPELHAAAYDALGLDWSYEPLDVAEEDLAAFIDGLGPEWRGLSLTMPLKQAVVPLLSELDRVAERTGVANTVLLDGEEVLGFNTDVAGIVRALSGAGLTEARYVHVLGGGATAASALVAAAELGAERVDIHVRDLEKSVWLEPLAHELGLRVRLRSFTQADRSLDIPDLVISTLPGGVTTDALYTDGTRRKAVLLDVAYDPWPGALASAWLAVDGTVVSGLAMLVHQALLQVRIFVSGDPLQPLPDEEGVLEAMLDAAGIDAAGVPLEG